MINSDGFTWMNYSGVIRKTTGPIVNGNAVHPEVMAVGASTSLNSHALYSNWGKEISVCAPANNFHPLDFQKPVPGRGIWTTDNEAYGSGFKSRSRYTGRFGGTSASTPLTAGIAALVLSANPSLHAAEVRNILETTSDKIIDKGKDHLGVNRSHYINGHSEWFGFGKVNAWRAVEEAARRRGRRLDRPVKPDPLAEANGKLLE
jgi:hypothetical protein